MTGGAVSRVELLLRKHRPVLLLLPAGTGHCNLGSSDDFLVVGAYPPGQQADICREAPSEAQLANIDTLSFPQRDPVYGARGGVNRYWLDQR